MEQVSATTVRIGPVDKCAVFNFNGDVYATFLGSGAPTRSRPFEDGRHSPKSAEHEGWRRSSRASNRKCGIVYKITHIDSGTAYIGLSMVSFKRRMQGHKSKAKQLGSKGGCRKLNAAIVKHGWNAFKKEVIYAAVPKNILPTMEVLCIAEHGTLHPNGYNLTVGGELSPMSNPDVQERARVVMQSDHVKAKREKVFSSKEFKDKVGSASKSIWDERSAEERAQVSKHMADTQRMKHLITREAKIASMTTKNARKFWRQGKLRTMGRAKRLLKQHPDRYIGRDPIAEVHAWWGMTFETRRRE